MPTFYVPFGSQRHDKSSHGSLSSISYHKTVIYVWSLADWFSIVSQAMYYYGTHETNIRFLYMKYLHFCTQLYLCLERKVDHRWSLLRLKNNQIQLFRGQSNISRSKAAFINLIVVLEHVNYFKYVSGLHYWWIILQV